MHVAANGDVRLSHNVSHAKGCSRSRRSSQKPLFKFCSIAAIFKFIILMVFARVGEASNPGPILLYNSLPGEGEPAVWGIAESHLTKEGLAPFRQEMQFQSQDHHSAPLLVLLVVVQQALQL